MRVALLFFLLERPASYGTYADIYLPAFQRNDYVNTAARCLQMMLKVYEYREPFAAANGIQTILSALTRKANFQLQYQLIFALW